VLVVPVSMVRMFIAGPFESATDDWRHLSRQAN